MQSSTQQNTPGKRFLILRNLTSLLDIALEEFSDFKQTNQMKTRTISVLSYIISIAGTQIPADYFTKTGGILPNLYRYIDSEEDINTKCEECALILGNYTDQSIVLPLIIKTITEMEQNVSNQPLYTRIKFLSNYLSGLPNITKENAEKVIKTLQALDIFSTVDPLYSKKMLLHLFKIYAALINSLGSNCTAFHQDLFFPLLLLCNFPETKEIEKNVISVMNQLANFCGFSKIEDLYSLEMGNVLEQFKTTYKKWTASSPDRYAFDIYVKLAGIALEKHWTEVLLIISQCCEQEKDREMQMDMILLLDKIIQQKELHEQLKSYTSFILPEILFPSTAWRVGRPNYKIRKAAMVALVHMFQKNLIEPEEALSFFNDFMTTLKGTLDDDYDAEIRYVALHMLKEFLLKVKDVMKYDHMADMYTTILKRLDDSQDQNRILTCNILIIFMEIGIRLQMSGSIYEYMISNSFIHLDDPNEEVRKAVSDYLSVALKLHTQTFISICEKNENSYTHKSIINDLKAQAKQLL